MIFNPLVKIKLMISQKRRTYTQQCKIDAVRLITKLGYKYSEAARSLGINRSFLKRWKNEMESNGVVWRPFLAKAI